MKMFDIFPIFVSRCYPHQWTIYLSPWRCCLCVWAISWPCLWGCQVLPSNCDLDLTENWLSCSGIALQADLEGFRFICFNFHHQPIRANPSGEGIRAKGYVVPCTVSPSAHLSACSSICPSVCPASLPLYSPQYFIDPIYIYLAQPLTLVSAWTPLIKEFLCSFSRIQWHFEILWIYWLTGFLV